MLEGRNLTAPLVFPPEITPLKAAEIFFTWLRYVSTEQLAHPIDVSFLPCVVRRVHVGDVELVTGLSRELSPRQHCLSGKRFENARSASSR